MKRAKMVGCVVGAIALAGTLLGAQGAQTAQPNAATSGAKANGLVAVPSLQALLPGAADWTKDPAGGALVPISPMCSYTFADAKYAKGDESIRLTVGDSGTGPESLMALASLVMALPEDYTGKVATRTIRRFAFNGEQAGEMWDAENRKGEFTVVIHGRFVVRVEGSNITSADELRAFAEKVDLKKLTELK